MTFQMTILVAVLNLFNPVLANAQVNTRTIGMHITDRGRIHFSVFVQPNNYTIFRSEDEASPAQARAFQQKAQPLLRDALFLVDALFFPIQESTPRGGRTFSVQKFNKFVDNLAANPSCVQAIGSFRRAQNPESQYQAVNACR